MISLLQDIHNSDFTSEDLQSRKQGGLTLGGSNYRYPVEAAFSEEKSLSRRRVAQPILGAIQANPNQTHYVWHLGGLYETLYFEEIFSKKLQNPSNLAFIRLEIAKDELGNPAPTPPKYLRLNWPQLQKSRRKLPETEKPENWGEISQKLLLPLLNLHAQHEGPNGLHGLFAPYDFFQTFPKLVSLLPGGTHHLWLDWTGNLTSPLVLKILETLQHLQQTPGHSLGKTITTFYNVHRGKGHRSIVTSHPLWKTKLQTLLPLKEAPKALYHYQANIAPMAIVDLPIHLSLSRDSSRASQAQILRHDAKKWTGTIAQFAKIQTVHPSTAYTYLRSAGWNPKRKAVSNLKAKTAAKDWTGTIAQFAKVHNISPSTAYSILKANGWKSTQTAQLNPKKLKSSQPQTPQGTQNPQATEKLEAAWKPRWIEVASLPQNDPSRIPLGLYLAQLENYKNQLIPA